MKSPLDVSSGQCFRSCRAGWTESRASSGLFDDSHEDYTSISLPRIPGSGGGRVIPASATDTPEKVSGFCDTDVSAILGPEIALRTLRELRRSLLQAFATRCAFQDEVFTIYMSGRCSSGLAICAVPYTSFGPQIVMGRIPTGYCGCPRSRLVSLLALLAS